MLTSEDLCQPVTSWNCKGYTFTWGGGGRSTGSCCNPPPPPPPRCLWSEAAARRGGAASPKPVPEHWLLPASCFIWGKQAGGRRLQGSQHTRRAVLKACRLLPAPLHWCLCGRCCVWGGAGLNTSSPCVLAPAPPARCRLLLNICWLAHFVWHVSLHWLVLCFLYQQLVELLHPLPTPHPSAPAPLVESHCPRRYYLPQS